MFNYNHLFYFYTVVREGGISAGARKLSITQPALSAQIRSLEKFMGKKLFQREGKGIKPTEFGLLVFTYTQKMFEISAELMEQLNKRGDTKGQLFRIGVSDDLERSWVSELVTLPRTTFISGPHEVLETKLVKGDLDVVFSLVEKGESDTLLLEKLDIPVVLGVPSSFSLNSNQIKDLEKGILDSAFAAEGWGLAVPSRSFCLRDELEAFLKDKRKAPHIVFEGEVLSAVTLAVETHQGAAFLPQPYLTKGLNQGTVKIMGPPGGFWKHHVYLLTRKADLNDQNKKSLITTLKENIARLKQSIETPLRSAA